MTLGKNIAYYRKQKGYSQEHLANLLGISRQAVTKWENGTSNPSSENLIRLSKILDVKLEYLLGTEKDEEIIEMGKEPWVYFGCSVLAMIFYLGYSIAYHTFSMGVFLCAFIVAIPIQLFLHLYFTSTLKSGNFSGIAGFDSGTEYKKKEVKKLLVKIDHHIGMSSAAYVMTTCILGSGIAGEFQWVPYLVFVYTLEFVFAVMYYNYQSTESILVKEEDRMRARAAMPVTIGYLVIAMAAVAIVMLVFWIKGISNNTLPALKAGGMMALGVLIATVGMIREDFKVKKWNPKDGDYQMSGFCKVCYGLAAAVLLLIFI